MGFWFLQWGRPCSSGTSCAYFSRPSPATSWRPDWEPLPVLPSFRTTWSWPLGTTFGSVNVSPFYINDFQNHSMIFLGWWREAGGRRWLVLMRARYTTARSNFPIPLGLPNCTNAFVTTHSSTHGNKIRLENWCKNNPSSLWVHTVRNLHFLSKNSILISREKLSNCFGWKLMKMLRVWTF